MMLDGASLSYSKYVQSLALVRIARKIFAEHPEVSCELAKRAVLLNHFCDPGWRLLMHHVKRGTLPASEGTAWADKMLRYCKDHPDLTLDCFSTFLDCFPKSDTRKRQGFFKMVAKLYDERPDLQIELRLKQGEELLEAGDEKEAFALFLSTAAEHGKEGRILLPVVEHAVRLARTLGQERQAAPFLDETAGAFPRTRGGSIAEAFQDLVKLIAPVFEAAGREKDADKLRRQAGL
jgi:hypothetical protein